MQQLTFPIQLARTLAGLGHSIEIIDDERRFPTRGMLVVEESSVDNPYYPAMWLQIILASSPGQTAGSVGEVPVSQAVLDRLSYKSGNIPWSVNISGLSLDFRPVRIGYSGMR